MLPRVAIIILNWNGFLDTCDCVESVLKSDYPNYEIFLVDNGSQDDSPAKLKERFPQVTFIQNKENLGFAGGNNNAIKQALKKGFDYFWLLNNDTIIDNNCLTILIETAQKNESVGLLTPLLYYSTNKTKLQHAGNYINWKALSIEHIHSPEEYLSIQDKHRICLWGTALLIKKSVIDSIGFLDDKFFAYFEDFDYCMRALKVGYKCQVVINTKIYHKHHDFDLKGIKGYKDHFFYYMARNGLWFYGRHAIGLRKAFIPQNYLTKTIQEAALYRKLECYEAVDATFDGLYHAILNINGAWDRTSKCPELIKRIIMTHPYFVADLINFRFHLIFLNILKRIKQKLYTRPMMSLHINFNTWRYQIRHFFSLFPNFSIQNTDNKKVSIIIPTLSKGTHADHLPKLKELLSVFLPDQTHKNYEAIVWCDGPNEMVDNMITSLKDKRIKKYSTDITIGKWGHPQTRFGVDIATGDFFVRMNDDNKPYKYYLQSLVDSFSNETGITYGRVIFKGDARTAHQKSLDNSFLIPRDKNGELKHMNIDCMCYMVRMDLAKKYIKYWNDEFAADWCFIEALLNDGIKSKFIDEIIGEKF